MREKLKHKSHRKKIPQKIVDDIFFKSKHKCCICNTLGINPEIHHIDRDPSNNTADNLIPLCPNCHSKVQQKGGKGRIYSTIELKRYRDDWFNKIAKQRKQIMKSASKKNENTILSALAQHEVRRINYQIEEAGLDWKKIKLLLPKLIPYGRDFGKDVRSEVLSTVLRVSDRTKFQMTYDVLNILQNVIIETLPIYNIVSPSKKRIPKKDENLILRAVEIAHDILWDICRYLRDPSMTENAAYLLYYILKYCHINNLKKVKKSALEVFDVCEKICEEKRNLKKFNEGKKILEKLKGLALEE